MQRGKKTYKGDMSFPHTGKIVNRLMEEYNIKQATIAKELGVHPTSVTSYRKRESSQLGIIWRLSKAFQYNILMEVGEKLDIPYETQKEKVLQEKVELLEKEIAELRVVVQTLKEQREQMYIRE